jgi:hypothetical protein
MFTDLYQAIGIIKKTQPTKTESHKIATDYSHAQQISFPSIKNTISDKIKEIETSLILEMGRECGTGSEMHELARRCVYISTQSIFPRFKFF